MPPTVSINLCCYNSEKYLRETLDSIVNQTYKDWELVIINDGSSDSTEGIIKEYLSKGWPIVYHSQSNKGLGYSRNKAIELSRGDYIAIIDHDDLWMPEKLEKQLVLFNNRPEIGLVYSDGFTCSADGQCKLNSTYYGGRYPRGRVLAQLFMGNVVICAAMIMRRSVLDHIGLFNPDYNQVEDYDLLLRISEKYDFDYCDEPLITYRLHENNASRDISAKQTENEKMLKQLLFRNPELLQTLGKNVVRFRLKGIWTDAGQAYLLHGKWRDAINWYGAWGATMKVIPHLFILFFLSLFPSSRVIKIKKLFRQQGDHV
jgi:glycosyltransferase involved in cell wall biosynthesis